MDFYLINEEYNKFLKNMKRIKEELRRCLIFGIQTATSLHLVPLCR